MPLERSRFNIHFEESLRTLPQTSSENNVQTVFRPKRFLNIFKNLGLILKLFGDILCYHKTQDKLFFALKYIVEIFSLASRINLLSNKRVSYFLVCE